MQKILVLKNNIFGELSGGTGSKKKDTLRSGNAEKSYSSRTVVKKRILKSRTVTLKLYGMNLVQFVFSFLYVRNWYSGDLELSLPRVVLFSSMLFLVLLGILMASILQSPVTYVVQ